MPMLPSVAAPLLERFLVKNRRSFVNQIVPGTVENVLIDRPTNFRDSNCMKMVDKSTDSHSRSITTEDLFIWSFQMVRGMDNLPLAKYCTEI